MRYLFINTCSDSSAALVDTEISRIDAVRTSDSRSQVEQVVPLISRLGADEMPLDCVVVSRGPAPFTGLRVGLVTARSLAAAWQIPVFGVGELYLQAYSGLLSQSRRVDWVVACADARRHEVYVNLFQVSSSHTGLVDLTEAKLCEMHPDWVGNVQEAVVGLSQWAQDFPGLSDEGVLIVGNAATQLKAFGAKPWGTAALEIQAQAAGMIVADRLEQSGFSSRDFSSFDGNSEIRLQKMGLGTQPQYLRRPDVQLKASRV